MRTLPHLFAATALLVTVGRGAVLKTFADQDAIPNYSSGTTLGTFSVSGTPDLYLAFTMDWNAGTVGSNKFVVLYFGSPADGVNFGMKSSLGPSGSDFVLRSGNSAPIDYAPDQVTIPTSVRFVGRIQDTNNNGDYDAAALWIDPTAGDLGTPGAQISGFSMTISPTTLGLRSVNLVTGDDIDLRDIVVTDDFASAIPEPTTTGLLGLAGLALLVRRSRRY